MDKEKEISDKFEVIKFCPRCGGHLEKRILDGIERPVCKDCNFVFYLNPTPAAAVVILNDTKVLFVKRAFEPRKRAWSLPAGFEEYFESPEECAIREVKEETGLDVGNLELLGVYSGSEDPRTRVVLIVYITDTWQGEVTPGDDASEARWFDIDSPPKDIAFRNHQRAVDAARIRI